MRVVAGLLSFQDAVYISKFKHENIEYAVFFHDKTNRVVYCATQKRLLSCIDFYLVVASKYPSKRDNR